MLVIIERQAPSLKFLPVEIFIAFPLFYHADAIFNGTDEGAEITSHTFRLFDGISVVGLPVAEVNGLMGGVFAGDIAESAMNALALVNICNDVVVDVQIFPISQGRQRGSDEIAGAFISLLIHPVAHALA